MQYLVEMNIVKPYSCYLRKKNSITHSPGDMRHYVITCGDNSDNFCHVSSYLNRFWSKCEYFADFLLFEDIIPLQEFLLQPVRVGDTGHWIGNLKPL